MGFFESKWLNSTCPHDCPSTCALEVERDEQNQIKRIRGRKKHSYTDGVICGKVANYARRHHHQNRLTYPLKRVGPKGTGIGAFEKITWEEALDLTVNALKESSESFGSESVWPYFLCWYDGVDSKRWN